MVFRLAIVVWLSAGLALAQSLVLEGAAVYVNPADAPIANGVVVVQDGRIAAVGRMGAVTVPKGVKVLDCRGLTLTAGFWNSHVHFIERKWANAAKLSKADLQAQVEDMLTRFGVTSAFDTGSDWRNTRVIRDRIESGEILGPRVRSTGPILYPKGGASTSEEVLQTLGFTPFGSTEISTAREAREEASKLLDAGTDGIKLYAVPFYAPTLSIPDEAIRAATEEAHRRGKLVFAHPTNLHGLTASVTNGVDVILHTNPQSVPWGADIVGLMKDKRVAVVPTLQLWGYETRHDVISSRERFVHAGVEQLRTWAAAGGVVLFGTDVGYMSDYDPAEEYRLMGQAGMSFNQILTALTTAPAERFGDSQRLGRVATGLIADLTVLRRDPSKDPRAFASVRYTVRDGKVIWAAPAIP
jgi:imidazolonepropionase-like amidohydrolase